MVIAKVYSQRKVPSRRHVDTRSTRKAKTANQLREYGVFSKCRHQQTWRNNYEEDTAPKHEKKAARNSPTLLVLDTFRKLNPNLLTRRNRKWANGSYRLVADAEVGDKEIDVVDSFVADDQPPSARNYVIPNDSYHKDHPRRTMWSPHNRRCRHWARNRSIRLSHFDGRLTTAARRRRTCRTCLRSFFQFVVSFSLSRSILLTPASYKT